ncbi:hypothetical protein F5J12DRAFT_422788 [Pisolithus orientalis]|uniref:uncharacterized protein n=1 Tax=Pisolithus orientalis TaxID=936130 RepID=UPI00222576FB|nr:uncharacterized protein F5J12DRAFT_422788 [Pisolithus orientalis]KAI5993798.1 hypothetical protein F5J12DRAFT_422788 [Pisolithus orientalis]
MSMEYSTSGQSFEDLRLHSLRRTTTTSLDTEIIHREPPSTKLKLQISSTGYSLGSVSCNAVTRPSCLKTRLLAQLLSSIAPPTLLLLLYIFSVHPSASLVEGFACSRIACVVPPRFVFATPSFPSASTFWQQVSSIGSLRNIFIKTIDT